MSQRDFPRKEQRILGRRSSRCAGVRLVGIDYMCENACVGVCKNTCLYERRRTEPDFKGSWPQCLESDFVLSIGKSESHRHCQGNIDQI